MVYSYYCRYGLLLMSVTETHWQLEPGLADKGSAWPDRLNILGDQAFYIQFGNPVMYSQMVPACFDSFGIVYLIFMFPVFFWKFHMHSDL